MYFHRLELAKFSTFKYKRGSEWIDASALAEDITDFLNLFHRMPPRELLGKMQNSNSGCKPVTPLSQSLDTYLRGSAHQESGVGE